MARRTPHSLLFGKQTVKHVVSTSVTLLRCTQSAANLRDDREKFCCGTEHNRQTRSVALFTEQCHQLIFRTGPTPILHPCIQQDQAKAISGGTLDWILLQPLLLQPKRRISAFDHPQLHTVTVLGWSCIKTF